MVRKHLHQKFLFQGSPKFTKMGVFGMKVSGNPRIQVNKNLKKVNPDRIRTDDLSHCKSVKETRYSSILLLLLPVMFFSNWFLYVTLSSSKITYCGFKPFT
jgi:hypothetical protein